MRVPADLVERARGQPAVFDFPAVGSLKARLATVAVGTEIKVSLGIGEREATKARFATASDQAQRFLAGLREGPVSISHKQVVALSGEVYRLVVERFDENPGSASAWSAWKAFNRAAKEGRVASAIPISLDFVPGENAAEVFGSDLTEGVNALPVSANTGALEDRFGILTALGAGKASNRS